MLLHPGAAMHGHEFSNVNNQRPGFRRSAFSTSAKLSPIPDSPTPSPSIRSVSIKSGTVTPSARQHDRVSFIGSNVERFEGDMMSEDDQSYAASETSEGTGRGGKRKKRPTISSISYAIAHPAPLTIQQKLLHIRPRLLFQLQRLSDYTRPIPVVDVLASTRVVPKLSRNFPRLFKGRKALGPNDVMIFKSEDYNQVSDDVSEEVSEDEHLGHREALAVICDVKSTLGRAEICLGDGSVWHASTITKGFEFTTEDAMTGNTMTVRWVLRTSSRRLSGTNFLADNVNTHLPFDTKYTFSTIQPDQRRHPVLASLTQNMLDIQDYYRNVSTSALTNPPTAMADVLGPSIQVPLERQHIPVDDSLKLIVQVTSVWVALRLGWCKTFKYNDTLQDSLGGRPGAMSRASSNADNVPRSLTPESLPSNLIQSSWGSRKGRGRPTSQIIQGSPSAASPTRRASEASPRRRAISAGTSFLQKRASLKRPGNLTQNEADVVPLSPLRNSSYQPSTPTKITPTRQDSNLEAALDTPTRSSSQRVTSLLMLTPLRDSFRASQDGGSRNRASLLIEAELMSPHNKTDDLLPHKEREKRGWKNGFGILRSGRKSK